MADVEVCPKHDVKKVNGKCWCCDQNKTQPEKTGERVPVATGGK